jgi:uncharacterized membrane protein
MSNSQTTAKVRHRDKELTVSQSTTDAPILPVAQIERLQQIMPERVDWVFNETQTEAAHRRSETTRINTFVFIERVIGQVFGLIIGVVGLASAVYAATHGAQTAGAVIGGTTVVGLVGAFVIGKSKEK